ncbi:MAG: DUF1223 domain-containing protein [Betaproteobacteria bacterium]|nr:MAG: DUF1223 domain-containing protein [Betaproteobacteria bacterium]
MDADTPRLVSNGDGVGLHDSMSVHFVGSLKGDRMHIFSRQTYRSVCAAGVMTALSLSAHGQAKSSASALCSAQSGAIKPTILELYTSEGCDSCPPADRWLSALVEAPGAGNTVALSFHVDYWDYIGWKDEFARKDFGLRHAALVRSARASGVYTPQLFINGRDDRGWAVGIRPASETRAATAALVLTAQWHGERLSFQGRLSSASGKPNLEEGVRLRYAVAENGIVTHVKAGENRGVTLKHDALVRDHGYITVLRDGTFSAVATLPPKSRRANSQLHVIAETTAGEAISAVSLRCD